MNTDKPLPLLEGLNGEFYAFCKNHALCFQRCSDCESFRHVPRELCAECGSNKWEWRASSGRGEVFTWTVADRPLHPAFVDAMPYAPVVVEMQEGVRVVSQVIDCAPSELEIGMAVEVVFEKVSDELTMPYFKRLNP